MEISLKTVSDCKLLRGLDELVAKSRHNEADLLAYIAEVDYRRLYLEQSCSSMYCYCTEVLYFSEASARHRIHAARAARAYPAVFERIRKGELHVAGLSLLAPVLTPENHQELLELTRNMSKRAIEVLLADRAPKPDVPARVRQLPEPRPAPAVQVPSEMARSTPEIETRSLKPGPPPPVPRAPSPAPSPLGGRRFKVQFTGSQALCDKLREAQALLRHQVPSGDLAEIFDRALTLLVEDAKRRKFAQTSRPRARSEAKRKSGTASRHIPAKIKRALFERDGGRCAFVGGNGRRCGSRDFLEYHHLDPWARAKRHSIDRIELRCRGHNHYAAVQDYGAAYMARFARRDEVPRGKTQVRPRRSRNAISREQSAQSPSQRRRMAKSVDVTHQSSEPGLPLKGPTSSGVTQPP